MSLTVVYILVAILLFGLLVLVHEFGHFLTAKLSGVQVNALHPHRRLLRHGG